MIFSEDINGQPKRRIKAVRVAVILMVLSFPAGIGNVIAQDTDSPKSPPEGMAAWDLKYRPYESSEDMQVRPGSSLLKRRSRARSRETWQQRRMLQMADPSYPSSLPAPGTGVPESAPPLLNPKP